MEDKGIDEGLMRRLKKLNEETRSVVRTKAGVTSAFETQKSVNQGCALSPVLFTLYIADLP